MYKFGYDSVDEYKRTGKERFSLLDNGVFDNPSCRLLLVNVRNLILYDVILDKADFDQGMQDEIFPIEDSIIPLEHGNVKEARQVLCFCVQPSCLIWGPLTLKLHSRFVQGAYHMGNPAGEHIIYDWLDQFK